MSFSLVRIQAGLDTLSQGGGFDCCRQGGVSLSTEGLDEEAGSSYVVINSRSRVTLLWYGLLP